MYIVILLNDKQEIPSIERDTIYRYSPQRTHPRGQTRMNTSQP